jgi:uncharacterized protein YeaO (DUF488 family)
LARHLGIVISSYEWLVKGKNKSLRTCSMIKLKRVYEGAAASDGNRFLVDRIWPRGVKKDQLALDGWLKDVAPSDGLRRWFGHDTRKWREFCRRYFAELHDKPETWAPILEKGRKSTVTLLYAARDPDHNNAAALRDFLGEISRGGTRRAKGRAGSKRKIRHD